MKLGLKDAEKRVIIKLDKSIKADSQRGFMRFGENNDYPQKVELIVNSSITAKSVQGIYEKFLMGEGFEADINSIKVGIDSRGKTITVKRLLRHACSQIALYNGFYIHANLNLESKVVNCKPIPFKSCRFSDFDDTGYAPKIGTYENWEKDPDKKRSGKAFDKNAIVWYNVFNNDQAVLNAQINEDANGDINKHKGQVYFGFLDDQYLYPLSPFDSVILDCDTESQVSIYKNNLTRNGMTKKTIIRMVQPPNDEDEAELMAGVTDWQGAEGTNTLVMYDEIDSETGELKENGAFKIDTLESGIDDALFDGWQKDLSNNIRKAVKALPSVLIDYEESKLGSTSGESIIQATNFYNAMTRDDREFISESFRELLSNFDNETLQKNDNWKIKELKLYNDANIDVRPTTTN